MIIQTSTWRALREVEKMNLLIHHAEHNKLKQAMKRQEQKKDRLSNEKRSS